jgi:hypothetical protein
MGNDLPDSGLPEKQPGSDAEPQFAKSPLGPGQLVEEANKLQQKLEGLLREIELLIAKTHKLSENLNVRGKNKNPPK